LHHDEGQREHDAGQRIILEAMADSAAWADAADMPWL